MDKPPTFTRHADGTVSVDRWTPEIEVTNDLLADAAPAFLAEAYGELTFHVANGWARYKITERGEQSVRATLVEQLLQPA